MNPLLFADLARGVALALLATLAARALAAVVAGRWRRVAVAAAVAWVLVPSLAIGYAWAALPVGALGGVWARQGEDVVLVALRLAPFALAVAWCAPAAPWSAAACVLAEQAGARGRAAGLPSPAWAWWMRGPGRRWVLAALIVFPLAVGEFEIGSRLNVGVWAVRLFDAQAGGETLGALGMRAWPVVALQAAALIVAWVVARGGRAGGNDVAGGETLADTVAAGGRWAWAGWAVLAAGSALLVAVPLVTVEWPLMQALGKVWTMAMAIRPQLGATALFGLAGGTCAWLLAGAAMPARSGVGARVWGAAVAGCAAVGLVGGMPVGLALLAALPPAAVATPVPLVAALAVLALPFALIARRLCVDDPLPAQTARPLMRGDGRQRRSAAALHWRLGAGPRWWAWACLAWWCAWELPASAVLHPLDMEPVLVLFYNFMHYGESAALSAQLGFALLVLVGGLAVLYPVARWWSAWWLLRGAAADAGAGHG